MEISQYLMLSSIGRSLSVHKNPTTLVVGVSDDGIYYIPIHHPSYICVYKRKQMDMYIEKIGEIIEELLKMKTKIAK